MGIFDMLRCRASLVLFGVALAVQSAIHQGQPPGELSDVVSSDMYEQVTASSYVNGISHALMYDRSVHLNFVLQVSGPSEMPVDSFIAKEEVSYSPTCSTFLDDSYVAVGGKRQQRTVIEIWKVRPPLVISPVGGGPMSFDTEASVRSKVLVYDDAVVGRDMVRMILRNRAKASVLFVQFYDSGDLYELDYSDAVALSPGSLAPTATYPLTKVLSSSAGGGVPVEPGLGDRRLRWGESRDHKTEGYIYVFSAPLEMLWEAEPGGIPSLWLFDHNRDGDIDETVVLTGSQAESRGLHEGSNYNDKGMATVIE